MHDVQDEPLFAERVAGLDIAKSEAEVAIRVPSDTRPGRRQQETRTFGTTRRELESLGDWLACWGVTRIGMEATGVIRGHQSAYATEADGPALTVPPSVTDGLSRDCLRRRHPTAALISRLSLVAAAFALPVTDVSVTARPGQCPVSSYLYPG